ncbi:hypothetical protein EDEG_02459 [Edhazardia aedis USNM 41457]|uniref:ADP,ATP carrier protein n=1 Tax=Edhazardia aedis (strain USNM 41457) TaxID=1003232 RepID=J9D6L3_EDHAE|nr:hypothetical protein EDEG_02459 [Edhazardia aedis USNM 41457]|eukprot:EJW03154.1 hypothetical protein EDEG_02459 [Edhazardia aedis USNM 41457]
MEEPQRRNLPTEDEIEEEANARCAWPRSIFKVAECEKPKFYRMSGMFFLIAYVYSVLRDTKDAVVMERQEPTSISFLKTLFVTPCSILFVFIIQKALMNKSVGNVLKASTLVFGVYFVIYSLVLLPLQSVIEPSIFWAKDLFGSGKMAVRGLQPVLAFMLTINFWTSSLLYVTSELWGNLILSLLFMSFANDVCSFKQSLRFVPIFYIISNLGLFLSGLSMLLFCTIQDNASYNINQYTINGIFFLGGCICLLIYFIQKDLEINILPIKIFQETSVRRKKSKKKVSMAEALKQMMKSQFLLQICFVVLAYNICTNLIDTTFKCTMKAYALANNQTISSSVMRTQAVNQIIISTSVITLLSTPFSRIVQIFGWRYAGFITPLWAITCCFLVLFLSIYNTGTMGTNSFSLVNTIVGGAPSLLGYERFFGMIAAGGLKTAKYAAFDISVEALSMRISKDDRATAKGIYAGIFGKLGKTMGSVITIVILGITNAVDIRCASQFSFAIILGMCALWMYAIKYLGFRYNESIENNFEIDLEESKNLKQKLADAQGDMPEKIKE